MNLLTHTLNAALVVCAVSGGMQREPAINPLNSLAVAVWDHAYLTDIAERPSETASEVQSDSDPNGSDEHYDEVAGFFMKIMIGVVIFILMYALSKRF